MKRIVKKEKSIWFDIEFWIEHINNSNTNVVCMVSNPFYREICLVYLNPMSEIGFTRIKSHDRIGVFIFSPATKPPTQQHSVSSWALTWYPLAGVQENSKFPFEITLARLPLESTLTKSLLLIMISNIRIIPISQQQEVTHD